MKSPLLGVACACVFSILTSNAIAALLPNAALSFDTGVSGLDQSIQPTSGSYYSIGVSQTITIYITLAQLNGIHLGTLQSASGSHPGSPTGLENANIDQPWTSFSNTGMHETASPVTILNDDGSGNVTLDFNGWGWDWNGNPFISLGGSPDFPADTGVATMTCEAACDIGDSFTLDYAAHVYDLPGNQASGLNGVPYTLHLEGTVVPLPATMWLFGSGLLGMIGISRRKKPA